MYKKEMTAEDVVHFYKKLTDENIEVWVDGGWGIDALIGKQTRPHGDLDIVVQEKDVPKIKELLESHGYEILQRDDLSYNYFHMADNIGHEIDITAIIFDKDGNGVWGPPENNELNPADSFKGTGSINGCKVKCISLEYAIKFRLDHDPWMHDEEDIHALCKSYSIEIPRRI